VIIGFLIAAAGMWISRGVTKDWGFTEFLTLQLTRSVGMALALFTAQNITMGTLKPDLMKSAGSLVNLSRNVGGAFGLAVLTTILAVSQAQHLSDLSARFSTSRPSGSAMLEGLAQRMAEIGLANPDVAAQKIMATMLHREALILAFSDCYLVLTFAFLAAAAAALMAKPTRLDFG
jgi:DHA2 family multidrug resistance protein